jgi:hypothetical protein
MWTQIVAGLILIIAVTYAIQYFLPRRSSNASHTTARWDIAPALGFFGLVLLALSLTEAIRREVTGAWALGIGLGVLLGIGAWIALGYRLTAPLVARKQSAFLATLRLVRTWGMTVLLIVIGIYLAVRIVGPSVEVFLSGAGAILLLTVALRIFVGVNKKLIEDNHVK